MSEQLEKFWPAVNALSGYEQADEDGVRVLASRQAIEEVLLGIGTMEQHITELEAERDHWRNLAGDGFHGEHGLQVRLVKAEAERDRLAAACAVKDAALEGMLEIAEMAMPDTYFESDSRVQKARAALSDDGKALLDVVEALRDVRDIAEGPFVTAGNALQKIIDRATKALARMENRALESDDA